MNVFILELKQVDLNFATWQIEGVYATFDAAVREGKAITRDSEEWTDYLVTNHKVED